MFHDSARLQAVFNNLSKLQAGLCLNWALRLGSHILGYDIVQGHCLDSCNVEPDAPYSTVVQYCWLALPTQCVYNVDSVSAWSLWSGFLLRQDLRLLRDLLPSARVGKSHGLKIKVRQCQAPESGRTYPLSSLARWGQALALLCRLEELLLGALLKHHCREECSLRPEHYSPKPYPLLHLFLLSRGEAQQRFQ